MKPLLAITMGDVNGIGPEILAKALANPLVRHCCRPLVIGDASQLEAARAYAPGLPEVWATPAVGEPAPPNVIPVWDGGTPAPERNPGQLDAAAGWAAVKWVEAAVKLAMHGTAAGMVTCPLNKEGIHRAGYTCAGHTDLIAQLTGTAEYRMSLFAGAMRVVHISSHCSLREAIELVTTDRIAESVRIADRALRALGVAPPRIAVAGLNPHAGEGGAFGDEERAIIAPAVELCRAEDIECSGPYPPDTVFRRMRDGAFDLVVALYHDQGHIPLKLIALDEGVNVTLGIPIIRTSVDHGTAYDIAGAGLAREHSLLAAISLAAQWASSGWLKKTLAKGPAA